jgi:hypothetical protein
MKFIFGLVAGTIFCAQALQFDSTETHIRRYSHLKKGVHQLAVDHFENNFYEPTPQNPNYSTNPTSPVNGVPPTITRNGNIPDEEDSENENGETSSTNSQDSENDNEFDDHPPVSTTGVFPQNHPNSGNPTHPGWPNTNDDE